LLLAYTGVQPAGTFRRETQAQCVAVGDGIDFEKSLLNPVVRHAHLPEGYSEFDFRDPKIWREGDVYYMVAANRQEERQHPHSRRELLPQASTSMTTRQRSPRPGS